MDAASPLTPSWGSPEEWNKAFEKIEDYLRAHRVNSRLQRARLTYRILATVAARPLPPGESDTAIETLAIEECRRRLLDWLQGLNMASPANSRPIDNVDGRVALLICDQALRWPYAFMEPGPVPEDMQKSLSVSRLKTGPGLAISHMAPRNLDLGLWPGLASNAVAMFARWPVLKVMLGWGLYILLLALLFWYTR